MKQKAEILIAKKSISRWIESADSWITTLKEKFSTMEAHVFDNIYTDLTPALQWFWRSGRREWEHNGNPTQIRFPYGLKTVDGAQVAIAYVRGLREAAAHEEQTLSDVLSVLAEWSHAGGTRDIEVASSLLETVASRIGRVGVLVGSDADRRHLLSGGTPKA